MSQAQVYNFFMIIIATMISTVNKNQQCFPLTTIIMYVWLFAGDDDDYVKKVKIEISIFGDFSKMFMRGWDCHFQKIYIIC